MKIHLHSDLHLEFGDLVLPGGDVLILAGDILTAYHITKNGDLGKRYKAFLNRCGKDYNQILMIPGNHEAYGDNINKVVKKVTPFIPKNCYFTDMGEFVIGDWVFLMTTLWSDFDKNNPIAMFNAQTSMNDFHLIRYGKDHEKFTPLTASLIHTEQKSWLKKRLAKLRDKNVFVITHHAPSFASVTEKNKHSNINGAYASELSELILDNPQIKYWVHGHMHDSVNYEIGNTKVIANPRGYFKDVAGKLGGLDENSNSAYNVNHVLEI